jgi:hypothetical protein
MSIANALASVAVKDLDTAAGWYEPLLGPGNRPMPEVMEWQFEGGGGLQVYALPERAGQCSCTLIVTDVDDITRQLHETGLAPDAETVRNDRVDAVMVEDLDGNSIAFSKPKDSALIR